MVAQNQPVETTSISESQRSPAYWKAVDDLVAAARQYVGVMNGSVSGIEPGEALEELDHAICELDKCPARAQTAHKTDSEA